MTRSKTCFSTAPKLHLLNQWISNVKTTPRVIRVDINRNTDDLNALVANCLRFAISLLVGFIKPLAVVWGARENGHLEFRNPSKPSIQLNHSKDRNCRNLKHVKTCNSWCLFTRKTFKKQLYTLEVPEFTALKFFCGDFSRTSNSHETKSSHEERKHILKALVWWVHFSNLLTDLRQISNILSSQATKRWEKNIFKFDATSENLKRNRKNIFILPFAWEKNCCHSYIDIIQIISKHIETVSSTLHPYVIHFIPGPRISPDRPTCRAKCPKIGCPSEASKKTHAICEIEI